MIITSDGHVGAPTARWAYQSSILSHRVSHVRGPAVRSRDNDIVVAIGAMEIGLKNRAARRVG